MEEYSQYHPHEVFHYCPKCGQPKLKTINFKAQECSNCGFVYYINSCAATAAIITDEQGNILLTKRAFDPCAGMYDLPGGFVDPMESLEESLLREVSEELNLNISKYEFFGSFPNRYLYKDVLYFTVDSIFICEVSNIEEIQVADDVAGYKFVKPTEVAIGEIGLGSIKKVIEAYIKSKM